MKRLIALVGVLALLGAAPASAGPGQAVVGAVKAAGSASMKGAKAAGAVTTKAAGKAGRAVLGGLKALW